MANEFIEELKTQCNKRHVINDIDFIVVFLTRFLEFLKFFIFSLSPIDILIQTMLILRDFEGAEHLCYIDIEIFNVDISVKNTETSLKCRNNVVVRSLETIKENQMDSNLSTKKEYSIGFPLEPNVIINQSIRMSRQQCKNFRENKRKNTLASPYIF